jgi:aryl-alcohol dehydrogenase-like predicted oxidoreductase
LSLVEALRSVAQEQNVTVAQVAIAWVLSQGDDIVPLIGARRRNRLDEALGALELRLQMMILSVLRQRSRLVPWLATVIIQIRWRC